MHVMGSSFKMNNINQIEYLIDLIRNDVSGDPAKKLKGTLFNLKSPISRHLESDSSDLRLIKNFCRQWVRDNEKKYDPTNTFFDRSKYVQIAKELINSWDKPNSRDISSLKKSFDYKHHGLQSSRVVIISMFINIIVIALSLKILGDINKGSDFFFTKREFLLFSITSFLSSIITGVITSSKINALAEVLISSDEIIIQTPNQIKFYKIKDLKFLGMTNKWMGLEKIEIYKFSTLTDQHIEISNKLLQFEGLREKLEF